MLKMIFINLPLLKKIFKNNAPTINDFLGQESDPINIKKIEKRYQLVYDCGFTYLIKSKKSNSEAEELDSKYIWLFYRDIDYSVYEKDDYDYLSDVSDPFYGAKRNAIYEDHRYDSLVPTLYNYFYEYITNINGDKSNIDKFNRNIKTLKIMTSLNEEKYKSGEYSSHSNTITMFEQNLRTRNQLASTLMHELIHMASTDLNGNSGFHLSNVNIQDEIIKELGRGLNEGYTELLKLKVLPEYLVDGVSYYENVKIARIIELFFDDYRDMENAYFNNDLGAVYTAFKNVGATDEEFKDVLTNLDKILLHYSPYEKEFAFHSTIVILYNIVKRTKNKKLLEEFKTIIDGNICEYYAKSASSYVKRMIKK